MMKKNKVFFAVLFAVLVVINSCQRNDKAKINESPTMGDIKIAVDESYQLLLDTEIYTFQGIYNYAKIHPFYLPEQSVTDYFLNDSVRLMITCKPVTKEEEEFLKSNQIIHRTTKIAFDAVAFITNKKNIDSLIRYNSIRGILTGKDSVWTSISKNNKAGKIKVVFDNTKSSNVRYIIEKFNITGKLPEYCFAVNSNQEVIKYVETHSNALGLLSVNWISDMQDSITQDFMKRINVVGISSEYDSDGADFYRPYQAYVANESYPFIRNVYAVSRETFAGLGSGFIQFIAGDQGQRIILKAGMVPATMPIRLIEIKE